MAGRIPRSFIDDLIARTDIVEVINRRVPLKKKGKEYVACCPFHGEKTPSFTVSQDKQFYHCFGCSAHGSALGFLMEYEHYDFVEAVEALAGELGLEVPREEGPGSVSRPRHDFQPLLTCLDEAARFFQQSLKSNDRAIAYLKQRGLSGEIARDFGLGYAPKSWDALLGALSGRFTETILQQAGLLSRNEQGRVYDKFRDRIMFPIRDRRGRVIAFGGRIIDEGEPKYLNSPETPVFNKSQTLYGLYEARQSRQLSQLIVVEGYMDVVALAQSGIHNAVATLGTATTTEHIQQLFRAVPRLAFCFDGDRAGRDAAWRALTNAIPALRDDYEADFLFLPDNEDPDSYVRKYGKARFIEATEQSIALSRYLLDELKRRHSVVTLEGRAQLAIEAKQLLAPMQAKLLRQQLETEISRLTGIEDHPPRPTGPASRPIVQNRKQTVQITPMRMLIAALIQNPQLAHLVKPEIAHRLEAIPGQEVLSALLTQIRDKPEVSPGQLLERFRGESLEPLIRKLMNWYPPDSENPNWEALIVDSLGQLEKQANTGRLNQLLTKAQQGALTPNETEELRTLFRK
ncbi:MAG: DNA primase [Thiotrichales bacterium]